MKFDFNKTLSLIKGGLLDQQATWESYLGGNRVRQQTAIALTGPLLITNVVLSLVFSRLMGGYAVYGLHPNAFMALVLGLVMAVIGVAVATFVFSFLAGTFNGKPSFDRAFAALSLAAIPGWVAGPIAALIPYLGFLVALAGGIASIYFMYKIIPLALEVPDEKRVVHFVVSIIVVIVINMIIGTMMARGQMNAARNASFSDAGTINNAPVASGMFGEIGRQAELMEAAQADEFDPPGDGEVSKGQVRDMIKVLEKTRMAQEEYAEEMERMAEEIKAKEAEGKTISPADMMKVYSGIGGGVGAANAEMEVVKTAGDNWAEYQWVKTQLRNARIQRGEGSSELEHNYELYLEYEEELRDAL